MACRILDLTVVRAEDVGFFVDVYALVQISSDRDAWQRTPVHANRSFNPRWDHTLRFNIPAADPGDIFLYVSLRREGLSEVLLIGQVFIPLRDLLAEPAGDPLCFPLSGTKNGRLFFSYKVRPSAAKYDQPPPLAKTNRTAEALPAYLPSGPYAPWGPYVPTIGYLPYMPPPQQPKNGCRYSAPPKNGWRWAPRSGGWSFDEA